ncbi:MAG: DUF4304 domain-containing protein [Bacteroidales bacterium]|jgi:hypothetical protein|nr:DUF4304 domain-containing protein [Bacteroidales bacterium]
MEKKELINILSEILIPAGFKRKGNYWVFNGHEITKMINLQKSQFGNHFYINYGYILNSIPLDGMMMHIYKRVASLDKTENLKIDELLNLENTISDDDRSHELKKMLVQKLVQNINLVSTEDELLNELKKRPHLNDIPLIVKRHFNLE